jgi:hypothetical protein
VPPPLPPWPFPEDGLSPSFGTKLFMLAQASTIVPSTEKCTLESSLQTCGRFSTLCKNRDRLLDGDIAAKFFAQE